MTSVNTTGKTIYGVEGFVKDDSTSTVDRLKQRLGFYMHNNHGITVKDDDFEVYRDEGNEQTIVRLTYDAETLEPLFPLSIV